MGGDGMRGLIMVVPLLISALIQHAALNHAGTEIVSRTVGGEGMRGVIMDVTLLISALIQNAALNHAGTEIVSRTVEGPIHKSTYADAHKRAQQLANALKSLGIRHGDRIGTIALNTFR